MDEPKKGTMIRVNGEVYEWLLVERAKKTIERKKPESFSKIIWELIENNRILQNKINKFEQSQGKNK